jgi:hypothetical protein
MNSIDKELNDGGDRPPIRLRRELNHRLRGPVLAQDTAGAKAPGDSSRDREAIADWLLCWDESYIIVVGIGNFLMASLSILG